MLPLVVMRRAIEKTQAICAFGLYDDARWCLSLRARARACARALLLPISGCVARFTFGGGGVRRRAARFFSSLRRYKTFWPLLAASRLLAPYALQTAN